MHPERPNQWILLCVPIVWELFSERKTLPVDSGVCKKNVRLLSRESAASSPTPPGYNVGFVVGERQGLRKK